MRSFSILILLLLSSISKAESLDAFSNRFVSTLKAPSFNTASFCESFWLPNQLETCKRSIPWAHVRQSNPSFLRSVPVSAVSSGFVLLNLSRQETFLLTATRGGHGWKMSLDLLEVWQSYSSQWEQSNEGFEVRFAEPLLRQQQQELSQQILSFHNELSSALGLQIKVDVPFYFLNSPKTAQELGIQYPTFLSGGARDGFVIIIGDPNVGMWSTLLHELTHIYSAFPGTLWRGKGIYPNAAFSEGLATFFQMKKVWMDNLPATLIAQHLCSDIQVAERLLDQDLLQLLDDEFFRTFDREGYHPAYLAGAAIVDLFIRTMDLKSFSVLWNEIGNAESLAERKSILLKEHAEPEIRSAFINYLNSLRLQMEDLAQYDCPDIKSP